MTSLVNIDNVKWWKDLNKVNKRVNMATLTVQFFETSWNTEHCNCNCNCNNYFANKVKNRNPATFWPQLDLGRFVKMARFRPELEPKSGTSLEKTTYVSAGHDKQTRVLIISQWRSTIKHIFCHVNTQSSSLWRSWRQRQHVISSRSRKCCPHPLLSRAQKRRHLTTEFYRISNLCISTQWLLTKLRNIMYVLQYKKLH